VLASEHISLEYLHQSPNIIPPIIWYWGNPISLSKFIGGVAAAVSQYMSPNTHMKRGSHRSVRENMAEK
jgi:hypothetical protein